MIETIGNDSIWTCDGCRKRMKKWEGIKLVGRQYFPGTNHEICSSDIRSKYKAIADLCPKCIRKLEALYSNNRKEKCV